MLAALFRPGPVVILLTGINRRGGGGACTGECPTVNKESHQIYTEPETQTKTGATTTGNLVREPIITVFWS